MEGKDTLLQPPPKNAMSSIPKKPQQMPYFDSKEIRLNQDLQLPGKLTRERWKKSLDWIPVNSSVKVVWHWGMEVTKFGVQTA